MKKTRPKPVAPLRERKTRVLLLLGTYRDACEAGHNEHGDGPRERGKPTAHIPRRADFWYDGSYKALERALDQVRSEGKPIHFAVWTVYVERGKLRNGGQELAVKGLKRILSLMPRDVYVPTEVSENSGYDHGEAKAYSREKKSRR